MARSDPFARRFAAGGDSDPREHQGAEIIDLATRNVLPQVAAKPGKSDAAGLAAGVAVVALLGAVTLWSMNSSRTDQQLPNQATAPSPPPAVPEGVAPAVPPQAITPPPATVPAPPPQQSVLAAPLQSAAQTSALGNPLSNPTIVFDASTMPGPGAPATALALPVPGAPATSAATGNGNEDFANRLGGVGGGAAQAVANVNPKTTVTQGTLIPAVLETAIDTDVPGFVRAIVSADVRSFDGSRVLVPRSSRLIGQYKSGLQAGQKRAYVIWTRLIRPDGVSVNIASPAIGFGGETGLQGKVDGHFFERFGSAMLLSVVGGLSALGGNSGVVIASQGQSAAAAAIGQTGQIGPTVRVRQGEPIRVFTARDLDFSSVSVQ
jgi:type IV secretion system protein VirB10